MSAGSGPDAGPGQMPEGTQVRDQDGHIGVVIRPEDGCWQSRRYRTTRLVCPDPVEGHVFVRLDQPLHTIRDYWYLPEQLTVLVGGEGDDA